MLSRLPGGAKAIQTVLRRLVVGIKRERRTIVGNGLSVIAKLLMDFRSSLKVTGLLRRQRHGLLRVGQAFGVLALQMICPGSKVVGARVIGSELNHLGVIGNCVVGEA